MYAYFSAHSWALQMAAACMSCRTSCAGVEAAVHRSGNEVNEKYTGKVNVPKILDPSYHYVRWDRISYRTNRGGSIQYLNAGDVRVGYHCY